MMSLSALSPFNDEGLQFLSNLSAMIYKDKKRNNIPM
jgi:hypothetical protein